MPSPLMRMLGTLVSLCSRKWRWLAAAFQIQSRQVVILVAVFAASCLFAFDGAVAQGKLSRIGQAANGAKATSVKKQADSKSNKKKKDGEEKDHSILASIASSVAGQSSRRDPRNPTRRRRKSSRDCGTTFFWASSTPERTRTVERHHYYYGPAIPEPEPRENTPLASEQTPLIEETGVSGSNQIQTVLQTPEFDGFHSWAGRSTLFAGSDFDELTAGGFQLLIQDPGSLGLDANATTYRESSLSTRDHLWIGDVNLVYELMFERTRGRIGLGINWLSHSTGSDAGFNLTAGFDHLINQNWTASGEMDLGTIGDADLFHLNLALGRRLGAAEWLLGYDYYDIQGVSLDSCFTGIRFRF